MSIYLILGLGLSFSCTIYSVPVAQPIASSDIDVQDRLLLDSPNEKYSSDHQIGLTKLALLEYPNGEDRQELQERVAKSEVIPDAKHIKYLSKQFNCFPNCGVKNEICDKMYKMFAAMVDAQTPLKAILWTVKQLENICGTQYGTDFAGINIPPNVNLSGRREGPLYAEEPRFILVRREDDIYPKIGSDYNDDPFIPPRGRKHSKSALSDLFNYYDLFVPNRGKKDNIGEILKYDDLFFPNRGKKNLSSKYAMQYKHIWNCEESDYKCLMIIRNAKPSYNL